MLDLSSGFWHVPMAPESMEKTIFVTHQGAFQFKVMPFSLCNAPSTFQRLLEHVLEGLSPHCCMDDISVMGHTYEEHLQNQAAVLD